MSGHVQVGFLSVADAAQQLGTTPKTVTRWCESGKLAAIPKPYGKKMSYQISVQAMTVFKATLQQQAEVKQSLDKPVTKSHVDQLKHWETAMAKGGVNGKPFSPRTIVTYKIYAVPFVEKYQQVSQKALQSELMRIAPAHFAKKLKLYESIVCFTKFLIQHGHAGNDLLEGIKPLCPKRHLPPKRKTVDEAGINSLIEKCDSIMDRVIVLVLSSTGLRASEFCALRLDDVDLEKGILIVRLGKGNKTRRVGLSESVTMALRDYLAERPGLKPSDFLFRNAVGKPLDRHGLSHRLERIGENAGVTTATPHALRRAFVTINANKGRPLQMLQRACGHSDIKTTMGYCITSEQEVIEAMKEWN